MNKMTLNLLTILLLSGTLLNAAEEPYTASHKTINEVPVIPKNEPGGISAFKGSSKLDQQKRDDDFDALDLATQGNKNASVLSGLNAEANKPKKHSKDYKRPRVGLVLSGGGARGGAHLGIIQAFEHHNIPIDAITGTSMGSFVGGLYASGMSSSEIERELTTLDWTKVITFDYDRKEIPFRRKHLQRAFPGNAKVGVNQDDEVVLGTGLFKRQNMLSYLKKKTYGVSNLKSFDDLRIPFRSVASRLEDGETVVLRDGDLAESIYASIAIPGGFDPITINGDVLVDGGVADNLPLDVMREEMDVDYIVVVDISTPYDEHAKFDNYIAVMGQLVNILMRKNVEDTIKSMEGKDNETLIIPDLTGYEPLDADKYPEIIAIGLAKGESVYNSDLSHLSLYEADYYEYLANRPNPKKYEFPVIDKIELENGTYLNDEAILSLVHANVGEKLDNEQLDRDVEDIYNLMIFDDVTYKVVQKDGLNVLLLTTTPSWDVNGQIKFAIGFEDNFDGHSDYFVKMEYIEFGLNSYGGEWRTRVSFGMENLILTEWYQPINALGNFYVRPVAYYRNKKLYVSPTILDPNVQADLDETFVLQAQEAAAGTGLGVNISKDLRVELFADIKRVKPAASFILQDSFLGTVNYETVSAAADLYNLAIAFQYDSLDNAFFPREGFRLDLGYIYSNQFYRENTDPLSTSDGTTTYSKVNFDYAGAITTGRHTFTPRLKLSQVFDAVDFENSQDFGSYSTLGGLFNLSGLPSNALTGNNMALASLVYRYRITEDGFFGALTPPTYIGLSLESGNAWYNEDLDPVNGSDKLNFDELKYAGSAYLAADTIIGPFYMGVGATEYHSDYYYSFYLSLGQSF